MYFSTGTIKKIIMHFLAKCNCNGDFCHCNDFLTDQPLPDFINKLSAAERSKLADALEAASDEDRARLLDILAPNKQGNNMNTLFSDALRGSTNHGDVKIPLSKSQQFTKLSDYLKACSDPDREHLIDDVISSVCG
jgi:hypothetical protein